MTSVKPPTVRFSGYRYDQENKPELFLPGYRNAKKIEAEIVRSPESAGGGERVPLKQDADQGYWRLSGNPQLQPGAAYRFHAEGPDGKPIEVPLDFLETVQATNSKTKKTDAFNRIAPRNKNKPQKSSVFADIYADSILTQAQIKALDQRERERSGWNNDLPDTAERLPLLPLRNHFNRFNKITLDPQAFKEAGSKENANPNTHGYEAGLNQLVPELQKRGFSAILFKPFIGGDNLSSHRYWTADPYILNDTFRNKASFRNSLDLMLKNGMKVFADGAFVNQGMNGVQVMSNLRNTTNSSYWGNWFHFNNHKPGARNSLPSLAQEPYKFGVLPTKQVNGHSAIDYSAFNVRVLNDPAESAYDDKKPTFIQLYDPRLEDNKGNPLSAADRGVKDSQLQSSKSSVHAYRFPVDPKELRKKILAGYQGLPKNAKFLDWENFSLTVPSGDDSSRKWEGQLDVALMNTQSEPVVNYLKGAVNYWSRMVMNHYTHTVAQQMHQARQRLAQEKKAKNDATPVSYQEILNAVTQDPVALSVKPNAILPPKTHGVDDIDAAAAKAFAEAKPDYEANQAGGAFAKTLLQNVPINSLQLPVLFKANLNEPEFLNSLALRTGKFENFMEDRLLSLIDIPYVGKPFELLSNFFFSPRLEKALGRKLQQVFGELSENGGAAGKLRHGEVQAIVADQLGEKLYISLLTGKSLKEAESLIQNPEDLEKAFYESLPPSLVQASPQEAARRLPALFRKRLRELDQPGENNTSSLKVQLRDEIETITKTLDPDLVNLAANVLKEREFGLNWRIDAAKDVADMDDVRNTPNDEKAREKFKKQIQYLNEFWGQKLGDAMRSVFPKSSVIAELTDFGELARDGKDGALGQTQKKNLFVNNTFTSAPNMEHTYSPLLQLVHYAQRPDEFGASQMTPSKFIKDHLQKMTQETPLSAQRHFQNLTSSHDYSTTSHALLVNPELFNQDRDKQPGLMEFFNQGVHELQNMACFANERETLKTSLGIQTDEDLNAVLGGFKKWMLPASNANIGGSIAVKTTDWPEEIYNAENKASLWDQKTKPEKHYLRGPIPLDFKQNFAPLVFELLQERLDPAQGVFGNDRSTLKTLALKSPALSGPDAAKRQAALRTLEAQFTKRMGESGEAKAMRGAINNAVVELAKTDTVAQNPAYQKEIWAGLNEAIDEWGTHFGYQPLEVALNHVFKKADAKLQAQGLKRPDIEKLKLGIYNTALKPVLAKQERIFAIQNALPGNPSVYLPDLFAQGGSELTKNIYGQNRGIIRADKLKENKDSDFSQYLDRVGNIFNSRKRLPVLNDGIVLPVETDDAHGILPIVRDDGKDQAIVLIDTGKPNVTDGAKIKPMDLDDTGNQYTNVTGQWEKTRTLQTPLKLTSQHLSPGTTYTDHDTHEKFKINQAGEFVQVGPNHTEIKQFAIKPNRVLVRDQQSNA